MKGSVHTVTIEPLSGLVARQEACRRSDPDGGARRARITLKTTSNPPPGRFSAWARFRGFVPRSGQYPRARQRRGPRDRRDVCNSAFETTTSTENAFVRAIGEQIGDVGAIVIAILGPVLFTILLVSGNAMAQAVRERTNELAVLKTLGFTDARVLGLVLAESLLLPLVAGAAGSTAWLFIQRANPTGGIVPMRPLSASDMVLVMSIAVLVGLTSGIVPAWRVRRLTVVDALRRAR